MKKLTILLSVFVIMGICAFTTSQNMQAPPCSVCLTNDGYSDPGEPWGFDACYTVGAEGFCGYANLCGPGLSTICYWYTCNEDVTGCYIKNKD